MDADRLLFDDESATPLERFALMLMERVQALEGSVALLEAEATTDELRVAVEPKTPFDIGALFSLADLGNAGGGMGAASRRMAEQMRQHGGTEADLRAFAEALGVRLASAGVDVAEVTVVRSHKGPAPKAGGGPWEGGLGQMLNQMLGGLTDEISSTTNVTVRLRGRHLISAVAARLTACMDGLQAALPLKQRGEWRPSRLSSAACGVPCEGNVVSRGAWLRDDPRAVDVALGEAPDVASMSPDLVLGLMAMLFTRGVAF